MKIDSTFNVGEPSKKPGLMFGIQFPIQEALDRNQISTNITESHYSKTVLSSALGIKTNT